MPLTLKDETPLRCTMSHEQLVEVDWRPLESQPAGASLELRVPQLRAFIAWEIRDVDIADADATWRWFKPANPAAYAANRESILVRARFRRQFAAGEPVRIRIRAVPPYWAGVDLPLEIWLQQPAFAWMVTNPEPLPFVREEAAPVWVPVAAAAAERLAIRSAPVAGLSGKVSTMLVPEDRFGNPTNFSRPVTAELSWNGSAQQVSLQGTEAIELDAPAQPVDRVTIRIPMEELAPQDNVANARHDGDHLVVTGNPVWRNTPSELRPAFGEIHWHSDISGDGARPLAEALRVARHEMALDFASPGDHTPLGERWERTVEALEAANDPGHFATLFSWENSQKLGHENYYFTDPNHAMKPDAEGFWGGRGDQITDRLREHSGFFSVPHHTNATAETRSVTDNSPAWHAYPWSDPEAQPYARLVEIFQTRGNMEREEADDRWRLWHQHNGASVQSALNRGYRLGFTGGTDNHCGWPSRLFEALEGAGRMPICSHAVTGLWTTAIDRQPIFDALYNRQTWACWDCRALVWFTVNQVQAGHELKAQADTPLTARIKISADDVLQVIELVTQDGVLWQKASTPRDIDVEVELGPAQEHRYVYLRALQRDGALIYASPVFLRRNV